LSKLFVIIQFVPHCEHSPCSLSKPVFNVLKGNNRCILIIKWGTVYTVWSRVESLFMEYITMCEEVLKKSRTMPDVPLFYSPRVKSIFTVATGGTHIYRRALVC